MSYTSYTEGDLMISYYKLKTPDKISVIGMKNGNEIIPHSNLDGFKEVFKSNGDDYKIDDFFSSLRSEGFGIFIAITIISIIIILISIALIVYSFK
jgi:hypothetical protein